jgi:hypothetical protein
MRRLSVVLLLAAAVCADELPQHVIQLARLKANMKRELNTLPDYTCLSVTDRYRQGPKDREIRHVDQVRLEVAFVGGKELFAWPGESSFQTETPAMMIGSGMFGTGDFMSHARSVFLGGYAVIRFAGETDMLGQNLLRWDYTLSPNFANYMVGYASLNANSGSVGSFWVDARTLDLHMLEVRTDGLPPTFPVKEVRTLISYARTRIGNREILLPERSVTTMTEANGAVGENHMEFSHCRQYGVQSAIRFEPEPAAESIDRTPEPAVPREITIPANLRITVSLSTPLDSSTSTVGQPIEAVVTADVFDRKNVAIPKGAVLSGRLRRIERNPGSPPYFVVGLEFTDLRFEGKHARFFGSLISLSKKTAQSGLTYRVTELPGVGTFVLEGDSFQLVKGLESTWNTQDIRGRK